MRTHFLRTRNLQFPILLRTVGLAGGLIAVCISACEVASGQVSNTKGAQEASVSSSGAISQNTVSANSTVSPAASATSSASATSATADSVWNALNEPKKIPFVKQMVSSGPGLGLAGIQAAFRGKVTSGASVALKSPPTMPFSGEFVYAATGSEFWSRIQPEDYKKLQKKESKKVAEFLRWLLGNPDILLRFNELGPTSATQKTWFSDWFELWTQRANSHNGLGRKVALTLSHANACGKIHQDAKDVPTTGVLARFDWFMDSVSKKSFLRDMEAMSHFDMRFVLGTHFSNSDLLWCQKRSQESNFQWRDADKIANRHRLVAYRKKNADGVHISDTDRFYEGRPLTIETYTIYGGQCVAISRTGAAFCAAAGVPVFLVTQPQHLAFFWKDTSGKWRGGNDLHGWNFSNDQKELIPWSGPTELVTLYDEFHVVAESARRSQILAWAARSERSSLLRRVALRKAALVANPANYEALTAILADALAQTTDANATRQFLLETGFSVLTNHPLLLQHILSTPEVGIFLQRSKLKTEATKFRAGIYQRFSQANAEALTGSPVMAATRFFRQNCPELKAGDGENPGKTHEKIKEWLLKEPKLDEKLILPELELAWSSMLANGPLASTFFAHSVTICTRKPTCKERTLRLLGTLDKRSDATASQKVLLAKWRKQIESIPNTVPPEVLKSQKPSPKPTSKSTSKKR